MRLAESLIFGCARLNGGGRRPESLEILRTALAGQITTLDTAPSYGMGAADALVGRAVRDYPNTHIAAKVGSRRPSVPDLRGWLSWARSRRRRTTGLDQHYAPWSPPPINPAAELDGRAMRRSLINTVQRLGRVPSSLLLHEVYAGNINANIFSTVEALAASHGINSVGYAHGAQFSTALDTLFPVNWIAQSAPPVDWILGRATPPAGRPIRLHTLAKVGYFLAATDPMFERALSISAARILGGEVDRDASRIATIYALTSARLPGVKLLISSTNSDRVRLVLAGLARWDTFDPETVLSPFRVLQ